MQTDITYRTVGDYRILNITIFPEDTTEQLKDQNKLEWVSEKNIMLK